MDLILREARPWRENQMEDELVDIAVEDGRIVEVADKIPGRAKTELVLDGKVVLPGLINCHTHLDKAFMGQHASGEYDVLEALKTWKIAKDKFTKDDIRRRARRAIDLAIRSGTTVIRSCVDVDMEIGLMGVEALLPLKQEYAGRIDIQLVAFPQGNLLDAPGTDDIMREAMRLGVDVVGGRPQSDSDRQAHTDLIFRIAKEFDRDIDMSVDAIVPAEDFDPSTLSIKYYAEKAITEGYQGRVAAHHVLGLSSVDPEQAHEIISLVRRARMNIITNPTSNLYTEGRKDAKRPRRGLTRVKDFMTAGVNVGLGTDNLDDVFMPHINADVLREAYVATCAAHLGTDVELTWLLNAITHGGARTLGIAGTYGIAKGKTADFVVLETTDPLEAITAQPIKRYVVKNGSLVVINHLVTECLSSS